MAARPIAMNRRLGAPRCGNHAPGIGSQLPALAAPSSRA